MSIDRIYRAESGRILATLIGLLGDFDLAEEAMQDAFAAAVEQWPVEGTPASPRAWLVSTARHKAVDRLRRRSRLEAKLAELAEPVAAGGPQTQPGSLDDPLADDRLRLIFTCCHPALAIESQLALTLRTLCGLTTEEIARAFLVPVPTMSQRIVRAKHKIRSAGIPYRVPAGEALPDRLEAVLRAVYLVFNEGYSATAGDALVRRDLCAEAIRLGRLLVELMPDLSEPRGLLALMLLQDSRREARAGPDGEMVLLEDQDRSLWDHEEIAEGVRLADRALRESGAGFYSLQAAIAALHARAVSAARTHWPRIAALYATLARHHPSPVVALNHAVAVAMADGPKRGLALLDRLETTGQLDAYHLLHAARADLLRRLGRSSEAASAYRRAHALATNEAERRFLARRLAEAEGSEG